MFMTFEYCIRNQKTDEFSHIGTYSPLEGAYIGWGCNEDGSSAYWDVVGIEYANIHTDNGNILTLREHDLRTILTDLMIVFRKELNEGGEK